MRNRRTANSERTVEVTVEYLRALRRAVGLHIDPKTAEMEWVYAQVLDPYGDYPLPDLRLGVPFDEHCIWQSMHPLWIAEAKAR